jgi:hypothetical protein
VGGHGDRHFIDKIRGAADAGQESPAVPRAAGKPRDSLRLQLTGIRRAPSEQSIALPARHRPGPSTLHPPRGKKEEAPGAWRAGSCGPPGLVLVRKLHLEVTERNCSRSARTGAREGGERRWGRWRQQMRKVRRGDPQHLRPSVLTSAQGISTMSFNFLSKYRELHDR